jgi:membrane protease YdiL (CAAX protease family)
VSEARDRPPCVTPVLALTTLLALAGVVLLAELLAIRLEEADGRSGARVLTWWDVALSFVEHLLIAAAAVLPTLLVLGRVRPAHLGLRRVSWRPAIAAGVVVYAAYLVATALIFAAAGAPQERASAGALADTDSVSLIVAYGSIACVLAPVTEEVLFRGFLFGALRERLPLAPACVFAGCLFGAAHGPPLTSMLDLAALGVALCVLYERTGSVLPCIGVHAIHNAIAFAAVVA